MVNYYLKWTLFSKAMLGLDDKSSEAAPETDEEKLIHSIKLGIYAMQQGKTF